MLRLDELPNDLLKKVLKKYLKGGCDGTPIVWRLVCKELRAIAKDEPTISSLQFLAVSIGLVRMMHEWIRDGRRAECRNSPMPTLKCGGNFVWHSHLIDAVALVVIGSKQR